MKALFFTLAAVASLLCLTPGILRGAPETEKSEIDPDLKMATLLERIEELEVRIINLEKRQPMIATPYHPLKLPQPIRPVPPAIAPNLENADTTPVRGPSSPPLVKATVQDTIADMAEVTLSGPNATDVQLNRIRALPTLKKLYLIDTQITGDGLEQLKELAQLEHLVIQGHQASDTGLERIKTLSHLRKLELWGDGITKEGLKYLEGMTRLEELDLGHTQVTDAGLQHLVGMNHLRILTFDSTQVTDAGLEHLKALNQLQKLYFYVGGNGITKEGMKSLQQALPKCKLFGLR